MYILYYLIPSKPLSTTHSFITYCFDNKIDPFIFILLFYNFPTATAMTTNTPSDSHTLSLTRSLSLLKKTYQQKSTKTTMRVAIYNTTEIAYCAAVQLLTKLPLFTSVIVYCNMNNQQALILNNLPL